MVQTDLVRFKNFGEITKSASESVLGAPSPANSCTSPANSCNGNVVTFTDAVGMLKAARDRVHQCIVAQQLMARVNREPESDSIQRTKSAAGSKKCSTSVDRPETRDPVVHRVKRSLAMVQPDPLRSPPQAPPQAPPQPQYPAAQMAQPSLHKELNRPRDTRAAAMPGARRSTARRPIGAVTSRQTSLAVPESDRLRSLYNPPAPISATSAPVWTYIRRRTLGHQASGAQPC